LSISNNIKILLDIQDKNITFEENKVYVKKHKGVMSKFITAKLTYTPTHCEQCGVKNENYTVYKNVSNIYRILNSAPPPPVSVPMNILDDG